MYWLTIRKKINELIILLVWIVNSCFPALMRIMVPEGVLINNKNPWVVDPTPNPKRFISWRFNAKWSSCLYFNIAPRHQDTTRWHPKHNFSIKPFKINLLRLLHQHSTKALPGNGLAKRSSSPHVYIVPRHQDATRWHQSTTFLSDRAEACLNEALSLTSA